MSREKLAFLVYPKPLTLNPEARIWGEQGEACIPGRLDGSPGGVRVPDQHLDRLQAQHRAAAGIDSQTSST
jgi:hypothetical protein